MVCLSGVRVNVTWGQLGSNSMTYQGVLVRARAAPFPITCFREMA